MWCRNPGTESSPDSGTLVPDSGHRIKPGFRAQNRARIPGLPSFSCWEPIQNGDVVLESGNRIDAGFRAQNQARIPAHGCRIPGAESSPDSGTHFYRKVAPKYVENGFL